MQRLLLTLPTPAENLALDEALLDWAEEENPEWEFLRVWESATPMVVVGRSSVVSNEVVETACARHSIPILRRSSGGAAVVLGPGCLTYALVLSYCLRPELKDIRRAHTYVLGRLAEALRPLQDDVEHVGTSDLAMADSDRLVPQSAIQKFSGNSLRAKRTHLLYHGTLLYDFDASLIAECLRMPPRQPDYRQSRPHADFVANLSFGRDTLVQAILNAWPTTDECNDWPRERVTNLVAERFSQNDWNLGYGLAGKPPSRPDYRPSHPEGASATEGPRAP